MVSILRFHGLGMLVIAWVGAAEPAPGQGEVERQLRALAQGPLVLSSGLDSTVDRFQFEVRVRLVSQDGSTTEQRSVAERLGNKAAVLLLSPDGFPACLLLERTCLVVASEEIKAFHGGHFSFHAGVLPQGGMGVAIPYSNNAARESQITLDMAELLRWFMADGAGLTWGERAGTAYSVATPGGARLFVHRERNAEPGRFPIRAVAATALGRSSDARIEVVVSNIYVGCKPPRTLFHTAPWDDLPVVPASFAQIKASSLSSLGASFNEKDPGACRMGGKLLEKLVTQSSLVVPDAELNRVQALVACLSEAAEGEAADALRELRTVGARYVWRGLQRQDMPMGRCFQLDYDRFKAAGHTEIALGPLVARMLRECLVQIVTGSKFSVATRCDALDLVGQFGLPLLSPMMTEIEKSLAKSSEEELQVVLSSVRMRHGLANDEDVGRLHHAVAENRRRPAVVTQAIEALAIVGGLGQHAEDLESLLTKEKDDAGEEGVLSDEGPVKFIQVPRRMRALAGDPAGQRMLLDLLECGSHKLPDGLGIAVLFDALAPADDAWQPLLRLSLEIALDTQRSIVDRTAANRVVHRDREALAGGYSEAFLQSALGSGEVDLISAALTNMVVAGQDDRCYELTRSLLEDADPAKRREYARMLALVGAFQRSHGLRLPDSFWLGLDQVFADSDLRVRVVGLTTIALLLGADTSIPTSYVKPLVETALESEDFAHLATTCVALRAVTRSDYRPPFVGHASTGTEFLEWVQQHGPEVREHLRTWHAGWQEQHWQPPPRARKDRN